MAYLGMSDPDQYKRAVRSSLDRWYSADFTLDGASVASGLRPSGGSVTDTTRPGVRRTASLEFPSSPGLYDKLAPLGVRMTLTARVRLTSQTVINIPQGVYIINSVKESLGGSISVQADDKWSTVQRADFLRPYASTPGISVGDTIANMINVAFGGGEVVNQIHSSPAVIGEQVWEDNLEGAILELAKGAGLWVYFDRSGVATIANAPTIGASADWLVDAPTELDREKSRERTRNVVTVSSSAAGGEAFAPYTTWDSDPSSPTYAGSNPFTSPETAAPFGIVPLRYETPLPLDFAGVVGTADSILYRVMGLASQVSLGTAPNPAIDAGDALDVLVVPRYRTVVVRYEGGSGFGTQEFGTSAFGQGSGTARPIVDRVPDGSVIERHIADTVTHPVAVDDTSQHIEGRSTRTDEFS